jgi:hypothetical protein
MGYSVSGVALMMKRATMSTTYKPALLRAIVATVRSADITSIPLLRLGAEFSKLYWNQVVVHKLRQAAVISKESEVVREIRLVSERSGVRRYSDLPENVRNELADRIARVLTIDVLRRFHASKPDGLSELFSWRQGSAAIVLSPDACEFIFAHRAALEMIANYAWAEYLELCNRVTPRVLLKVSGEIKRGSLAVYLPILLADGEHFCFYCKCEFDGRNGPHIDHVIPWSFALEDKLWDLVLCCKQCNAAKSDWLPDRTYIEKLIVRNTMLRRADLPDGVSALAGEDDVMQLYEVAIATDWPRFWVPS